MAERIRKEYADTMMDRGYHCSQVVAAHVAECMGLDVKAALRLTAALGMGCNHGDTCGVISAGALAIGLCYGFDSPDASEANTVLVGKVKEYERRFQSLHGSLLCRTLLKGYDAAIEGMQAPADTWDSCGSYCADGCAILDEMLGSFYKSPVE